MDMKTLPTGLTYYVAYPYLPRRGNPNDRPMKVPEYAIGHHWGTQMNITAQDTVPEQYDILVRTAKLHLTKDYARGIQYHWVIFIDGTTYYTREDHEWENHCSNGTINKKSIGISFCCNTSTQGLTDAQKKSASRLIQYYEQYKKTPRPNVRGHTEVAINLKTGKLDPKQTSCPGTAGMKFIKDYRLGVYDKPVSQPTPPADPCATVKAELSALSTQNEDLKAELVVKSSELGALQVKLNDNDVICDALSHDLIGAQAELSKWNKKTWAQLIAEGLKKIFNQIKK